MPTIVKHQRAPITSEHTARSTPIKIIHKIFNKTEAVLPEYSTSLPNGNSIKFANLKHCVPKGIPTMVKHEIIPTNAHF